MSKENKQFFKRERLTIFLNFDENLDNLIDEWSERFVITKLQKDKENIVILESVEEDKK